MNLAVLLLVFCFATLALANAAVAKYELLLIFELLNVNESILGNLRNYVNANPNASPNERFARFVSYLRSNTRPPPNIPEHLDLGLDNLQRGTNDYRAAYEKASETMIERTMPDNIGTKAIADVEPGIVKSGNSPSAVVSEIVSGKNLPANGLADIQHYAGRVRDIRLESIRNTRPGTSAAKTYRNMFKKALTELTMEDMFNYIKSGRDRNLTHVTPIALADVISRATSEESIVCPK